MWIGWVLGLAGCGAGDVGEQDLPPVDTSSPILEDTSPFIVDTAQGTLDEEPKHTVTVIDDFEPIQPVSF